MVLVIRKQETPMAAAYSVGPLFVFNRAKYSENYRLIPTFSKQRQFCQNFI